MLYKIIHVFTSSCEDESHELRCGKLGIGMKIFIGRRHGDFKAVFCFLFCTK